MGVKAAAQRVQDSIAQLINAVQCGGLRGQEPQDLITPVQAIGAKVAQLVATAKANPKTVPATMASLQDSVKSLLMATKAASGKMDPKSKEDLLAAAQRLS